MSAAVIDVADLRSVCPGNVRRMRAEAATVNEISEPVSGVRTIVLPLTDFTEPSAFVAAVWARPLQVNASKSMAKDLHVRNVHSSRITSPSIQSCAIGGAT